MSEFIIMACINCVFEVALHSVYIYKCCGCVGYWFVYEACRKVAGCIVIDVTSNVSNIIPETFGSSLQQTLVLLASVIES